MVESALGIDNAPQIAAHPRVVRLAFGSIDFALDIGAEETWEPLLLARSTVVQASRLGHPPPIDGVTVTIDDLTVVEEAMRRSKALGFGAKLCIHPDQVPAVMAALLPSDEEIRRAQQVLKAVGSVDGTDAIAFDGAMVDRPVIERARRIQIQHAASAERASSDIL